MKNMKTGYIVHILKQDNLGVIREDSTQTEWLFFLDEVTEQLPVYSSVAFFKDEEYEQFVATQVRRVNSNPSSLAV